MQTSLPLHNLNAQSSQGRSRSQHLSTPRAKCKCQPPLQVLAPIRFPNEETVGPTRVANTQETRQAMSTPNEHFTLNSVYLAAFAQAREPHVGLLIASSADSGTLFHIRIDRDASPNLQRPTRDRDGLGSSRPPISHRAGSGRGDPLPVTYRRTAGGTRTCRPATGSPATAGS